MAIEDGTVLTRALDQADSIPDALQLYQRNRVDRMKLDALAKNP
jgi:salicylate hydroxylase